MAAADAKSLSLPGGLDRLIKRFTAALRHDFGPRLRAAYLYGSAVTGGFRPGRSDLNVLVILDRVSPRDLDLVAAARREPLSPAVLAAGELAGLAAAAPLTLWDIAGAHRLLTGEHLLARLTFEREALATQLRFELRDKLLALRAGCQAQAGRRAGLLALAETSFGSVLALLRAAARLAGAKPDRNPVDTLGDAARRLGLDLRTLQALYQVRQGQLRPRLAAFTALLTDYFALLETAISRADAFVPAPKPDEPPARPEKASAKPAEPEAEPEPKPATDGAAEPTVDPPAEPQAPEPQATPAVEAQAPAEPPA
jgi:hypothetical protein